MFILAINYYSLHKKSVYVSFKLWIFSLIFSALILSKNDHDLQVLLIKNCSMKIIRKNMLGHVMLDTETKGETLRRIMQSGVLVKLVGTNFASFPKRCVRSHLIISNLWLKFLLMINNHDFYSEKFNPELVEH